VELVSSAALARAGNEMGKGEQSGEKLLIIGRNQTFYEALRAQDAPHTDIMALVQACQPYRNLRRVKRGDEFRVCQAADGGIRRLSFDLDEESYLTFRREGDIYTVLERTYPVEQRVCAVSGTIKSSLYASLKAAGAPLSLAPKMNDILGWEIDFQRDLRQGDTFRILYEEIWREGALVRTGSILALSYVNRSRTLQAYHFTDMDGRPGYYDADGNNLQKQLMRAPLEYSRISSGFSWRRFHPVLKRYMPHLGIDYAAPVGTPVRASGGGTILEAGHKRGNGRYIKIRHDNRAYESYYLHLSRFATGIKKGATVSQGQVIGYVGATGYSTGPHLDYRVKKNGTFVNPRQLKLPAAEPVSATSRTAFRSLTLLYEETLTSLAPNCTPHQVALALAVHPPLRDPHLAPSVLLPPRTPAPRP
jgi:murein DD-endopeptidase MepM/ murein hydrolase activator NlpD